MGMEKKEISFQYLSFAPYRVLTLYACIINSNELIKFNKVISVLVSVAAVTNYHCLGGLKQQALFSHSSRGRKSVVKR